jgi:hypothetical protein
VFTFLFYVFKCALLLAPIKNVTQEREELSAAQASLELRTLSVAEADELKAANEALKSKVTALQQVIGGWGGGLFQGWKEGTHCIFLSFSPKLCILLIVLQHKGQLPYLFRIRARTRTFSSYSSDFHFFLYFFHSAFTGVCIHNHYLTYAVYSIYIRRLSSGSGTSSSGELKKPEKGKRGTHNPPLRQK